jgi:hypothetical protein
LRERAGVRVLLILAWKSKIKIKSALIRPSADFSRKREKRTAEPAKGCADLRVADSMRYSARTPCTSWDGPKSKPSSQA